MPLNRGFLPLWQWKSNGRWKTYPQFPGSFYFSLTLEESQFFPLIPDYSFRSETRLPWPRQTKCLKIIICTYFFGLLSRIGFLYFRLIAGLKQVQSLKDSAAHPQSKFKGVPPPRNISIQCQSPNFNTNSSSSPLKDLPKLRIYNLFNPRKRRFSSTSMLSRNFWRAHDSR